MKPRRHLLVLRRILQQVARDLLDGELVERHVLVERLDHPVAIRPHLAVIIEMQTMRVSIPRRIQPVTRPMLPISGRFQQPLHQFQISVLGFVLHETLHLGWRRRQTGQIERHAPG